MEVDTLAVLALPVLPSGLRHQPAHRAQCSRPASLSSTFDDTVPGPHDTDVRDVLSSDMV